MTKVLRYFELNGLAESIRYILLYTDQKFEDVRYDYKTWPIKKVKDSLPFGKLPVLEDNGRVLHQSLPIARYVATNTELLPSDPWEQAILDATVQTIYDFDKSFVAYFHASPEQKEEVRNKFYEALDFYFSRFEEQLKKNNGHFGSKLNWADFVFVGIIECINLFFDDEIQKNYPTISELMIKITSLPRVKDYVKNRKPYEKL